MLGEPITSNGLLLSATVGALSAIALFALLRLTFGRSLQKPRTVFGFLSVAGALVASEYFAEVRDAYDGYPMSVELGTGLFLLAATYVVVEQLIARRSAEQWSTVSELALDALSRHGELTVRSITNAIDTGLQEALDGGGLDDEDRKHLLAVQDRLDEIVWQAHPTVDGEFAARVAASGFFLAVDSNRSFYGEDWVPAMRRAQARLRDVLTAWLPAIVASPDAARLADALSVGLGQLERASQAEVPATDEFVASVEFVRERMDEVAASMLTFWRFSVELKQQREQWERKIESRIVRQHLDSVVPTFSERYRGTFGDRLKVFFRAVSRLIIGRVRVRRRRAVR